MITPIAVYDLQTGEIKSTGGIQFDADMKDVQINAALAPWGGFEVCGLYEGVETASPETQYIAVLDGVAVLADRSPLIVEVDKTTLVADGIDSITLTGLPDPCDIIIDDPDPLVETSEETVTGGGFVFVADDPGVYTVEVRRWPFLSFKIEFTAT